MVRLNFGLFFLHCCFACILILLRVHAELTQLAILSFSLHVYIFMYYMLVKYCMHRVKTVTQRKLNAFGFFFMYHMRRTERWLSFSLIHVYMVCCFSIVYFSHSISVQKIVIWISVLVSCSFVLNCFSSHWYSSDGHL